MLKHKTLLKANIHRGGKGKRSRSGTWIFCNIRVYRKRAHFRFLWHRLRTNLNIATLIATAFPPFPFYWCWPSVSVQWKHDLPLWNPKTLLSYHTPEIKTNVATPRKSKSVTYDHIRHVNIFVMALHQCYLLKSINPSRLQK